MNSYTIVTPGEQNFEELTAVWEASVRATHNFLPEEDILYFRSLILNEYLKAVRLFCVADPEEGIFGFCGISDETLEMLFVRPDCFGKGIGKMLMQRAVNEGVTKIDVNEQNPGALAFYLHQGFAIVGRSPRDPQGKPYPILHLELTEK